MQSISSARQSEVKAWEEEINPCEHTLTIEQFVSDPIQASGPSLSFPLTRRPCT
jgi:ubiquitin carboxyl-terminal hydrolase 5/13